MLKWCMPQSENAMDIFYITGAIAWVVNYLM